MTECPKCKFYNICKGRINETVENCVRFKSTEQTNEEWFCSLPTEEKAKFMCDIYEMGKNGKEYFMRLDKEVEWLKQPHKPIS